MTLTNRGFNVSAPRPGRSIVLDARRDNVALEIHLRSSQGLGPAYWPKSILIPSANRYGGLALLDDEQPPKLYLIPSRDWNHPDGLLVDRTYIHAASAPEWGVNLPGRRSELKCYELDRVLPRC